MLFNLRQLYVELCRWNSFVTLHIRRRCLHCVKLHIRPKKKRKYWMKISKSFRKMYTKVRLDCLYFFYRESFNNRHKVRIMHLILFWFVASSLCIKSQYIEWRWAVINTTKYNLLAKRWRLAGNYMFRPFIVATPIRSIPRTGPPDNEPTCFLLILPTMYSFSIL
jgi:hypothetical protein